MKVVVEVTDTFERYDCAVVVYCDGTEIYRRGDMESDLTTAIGRLRSDLYIKRLAKLGESS